MTISLGILDQSTIASGRGADEAIRETLALAKLADQWGYGRYWLAEHHNSHSHAGSAPEPASLPDCAGCWAGYRGS